MLVAAVLCLCGAAVAAASGVWSLTRRPTDDYVHQVLRAVAPTQLAAAVMLAAGAVASLSLPAPTSTVVLAVCVIGAVGTVAAGCWQAAKSVARRNAATAATSAECGTSACASCTLSCGSNSG
ncbi:hypothetical protein ACQI4F_25145 [Mycolicibacterium vaccae]|uniref:hypothetical protein n=1 Tax=Mycolicibacterium vaccae TaxID=1810 RepID=UPI003CEC6554